MCIVLTFKANYLNSATIQRINIYKSCPKKVSFVEINPTESLDVLAANKIAAKWDKTGDGTFAHDICRAINRGEKSRFFALTTQQDTFEKLDYEKILSLAQVKTEKEDEYEEFIEFLQVDPDNLSSSYYAEFSHIGTAMLDSLKKLFCKKCIGLNSVRSAIKFYLRNGFKDTGIDVADERRMIWESAF